MQCHKGSQTTLPSKISCIAVGRGRVGALNTVYGTWGGNRWYNFQRQTIKWKLQNCRHSKHTVWRCFFTILVASEAYKHALWLGVAILTILLLVMHYTSAKAQRRRLGHQGPGIDGKVSRIAHKGHEDHGWPKKLSKSTSGYLKQLGNQSIQN